MLISTPLGQSEALGCVSCKLKNALISSIVTSFFCNLWWREGEGVKKSGQTLEREKYNCLQKFVNLFFIVKGFII